MICEEPFVSSAGQAFGCGRCPSCLINRSRIWATRIRLECAGYAKNSFVTLTYAPENLPVDCSLDPRRLRNFLDNLRARSKRILKSPISVRYYAVGEYGDKGNLPHYHLVLFGYPSCERWPNPRLRPKYSKCCVHCDFIGDMWPEGRIQVEPMSDGLSDYAAGYIQKNWTKPNDPRLMGRFPEFARRSLKPGIGALAMHDVADILLKYTDALENGDVPVAVNIGGKPSPLGRYLRGKLRMYAGVSVDGKAPQSALDAQQERMLPLRESAKADDNDPSLKSHIKKEFEGQILNRVARAKLFRKRRKL